MQSSGRREVANLVLHHHPIQHFPLLPLFRLACPSFGVARSPLDGPAKKKDDDSGVKRPRKAQTDVIEALLGGEPVAEDDPQKTWLEGP